jgi:hypothetical protein
MVPSITAVNFVTTIPEANARTLLGAKAFVTSRAMPGKRY